MLIRCIDCFLPKQYSVVSRPDQDAVLTQLLSVYPVILLVCN